MEKEITIIGFVKEVYANWKTPKVGIANEDGIYIVKMNAEGKNLQYEVGNKVKATGTITRTNDGIRRVSVTGYEVYEVEEDGPDDFYYDFKLQSGGFNFSSEDLMGEDAIFLRRNKQIL